MEDLSPPPSRAEGHLLVKKPEHCATVFSYMGANNSKITPLNCICKKTDKFDPQSLRSPFYAGFLCFKRRLHLPRDNPAGKASYQSVHPCHQNQFEHLYLNFSYETMTTKRTDDIFDTECQGYSLDSEKTG